jgi:hypothetical protein
MPLTVSVVGVGAGLGVSFHPEQPITAASVKTANFDMRIGMRSSCA